jgi:hypothetical protein
MVMFQERDERPHRAFLVVGVGQVREGDPDQAGEGALCAELIGPAPLTFVVVSPSPITFWLDRRVAPASISLVNVSGSSLPRNG